MAEQTTAPSKYVVLRKVATSDPAFSHCWVEVKVVAARSQVEAIKDAADTAAAATYAAVPSRSWAPVTLKPRTVTTFEIAAPAAAPAVEGVQP